jgi:hypothetical protein
MLGMESDAEFRPGRGGSGSGVEGGGGEEPLFPVKSEFTLKSEDDDLGWLEVGEDVLGEYVAAVDSFAGEAEVVIGGGEDDDND